MKLFEMHELPKTAGKAVLKFVDPSSGMDFRRSGEKIQIPEDPEMDFFPLMDGQQFLARRVVGIGHGTETQVFFGGTDEQPFLVRLDSGVFHHFSSYPAKERGKQEENFKAALKPETIVSLERTLKVKAIRQGDIFACPIPCDLDVLIVAATILQMGNVDIDQEQKTTRLFGTRHKITGKVGNFRGNAVIAGLGVLEAPDHKPVELDRPHVLAQARYLYSPRDAD